MCISVITVHGEVSVGLKQACTCSSTRTLETLTACFCPVSRCTLDPVHAKRSQAEADNERHSIAIYLNTRELRRILKSLDIDLRVARPHDGLQDSREA